MEVSALTTRLLEAGLDLVQPFDVARYNERIADRPGLPPLPLFGRAGALGLVIGNSRALWPRFIAALRSRQELLADDHPLDRYVAESIRSAAALVPARFEVRFSHDAGPRFVSMLDLAAASGLAQAGPAYLAVHPEHGPWISLRGVLVVDRDPIGVPKADPPVPCDGCSAPCTDALAKVQGLGVEAHWRSWIEVRDACPIGRSSRYGEAQLRYHYAKDRSALFDEASRN